MPKVKDTCLGCGRKMVEGDDAILIAGCDLTMESAYGCSVWDGESKIRTRINRRNPYGIVHRDCLSRISGG